MRQGLHEHTASVSVPWAFDAKQRVIGLIAPPFERAMLRCFLEADGQLAVFLEWEALTQDSRALLKLDLLIACQPPRPSVAAALADCGVPWITVAASNASTSRQMASVQTSLREAVASLADSSSPD